MAYLLDTIAVIRWWTEPDNIGELARRELRSSDAVFFFSVVSVWEIANKSRIGKLPQILNFQDQFSDLLHRDAFTILNLTEKHAMRAGYLPGDHRDPFDRLLAGQALVEGLTIVTNDPQIAAFGCRVLW